MVSIAFDNGSPVEKADSTTATTDIFANADNSKCPDDCFRPVGLAFDSKDRLFVSSDATHEIYVLVRTSVTSAAPSSSSGSPSSTSTSPSSTSGSPTSTSSSSPSPTKSSGAQIGTSVSAGAWATVFLGLFALL